MPANEEFELIEAIEKAARAGAGSLLRNWNVPTVTERTRLVPNDATAGSRETTLLAQQFGVGWTGTATTMPFTADVSTVDASLNSVDIVTGLNLAGEPAAGGAAGLVAASSQYLDVASHADFVVSAGQDFAICAWVKPASAAGNNRILTKWGAAGAVDEWLLQIAAGGANFQAAVVAADQTTFTLCSSTGGVSVGAWTMLYTDWDHLTGNLRLSFNNGAFAATAGPANINTGTAAVVVGSDVTHANFFDGAIDATGFWKRKLTGLEITALWNGGAGVRLADLPGSAVTGLSAWWELDGPNALDGLWHSQVNNHHLTSHGAARVVGKT